MKSGYYALTASNHPFSLCAPWTPASSQGGVTVTEVVQSIIYFPNLTYTTAVSTAIADRPSTLVATPPLPITTLVQCHPPEARSQALVHATPLPMIIQSNSPGWLARD